LKQASVLKELFEDKAFIRSHGICSINSINWARIAVQSTYYVWAYLRLFDSCTSRILDESAIGLQEVVFCVPTGAFGNAMGGFIAKQMGVPIHRIICATNANDIVHRCLTTGDLSMGANIETYSPAMDIQFAYNLERMLYYICNQNPVAIRDIMAAIDKQFAFIEASRGVILDPIVLAKIKSIFVSCSVSDEQTLHTISQVRSSFGVELCPHSAIGVHAASETFASLASQFPTFCVLTANASKFEETFAKATDHSPHLREDVIAMRSLPVKFSRLEKTALDNNWREKWIDQLKSDITLRMK
jgi:threonine synthase